MTLEEILEEYGQDVLDTYYELFPDKDLSMFGYRFCGPVGEYSDSCCFCNLLLRQSCLAISPEHESIVSINIIRPPEPVGRSSDEIKSNLEVTLSDQVS